MAMNKKEKLYLAELEQKLAVFEANKTTHKVHADIPPPSPSERGFPLTVGWIFNPHSKVVSNGCSSAVGHSRTRTDKTQMQRPIWLYSTELLATQALRYEVEQEQMQVLASIDKKIKTLQKGSVYD